MQMPPPLNSFNIEIRYSNNLYNDHKDKPSSSGSKHASICWHQFTRRYLAMVLQSKYNCAQSMASFKKNAFNLYQGNR